ncbi:hypothetical protein NMG60_11028706 [Bertholletia excelsa]
MEWSAQNTKVFIEIIYDRVKKKQLQGSTFKPAIWEDINNDLTMIIGENYGVDRLRGKFNRIRVQHREFSALLARTGVTWDSKSNKVNAPENVWQDLYTKGKYYKQFKKQGFEHDYNILGEIFNTSTTTGKLGRASTHEPQNLDEEQDLEEDFLSKGMHIDTYVVDDEGDNLKELSRKRNSIESSSERQCKEAKSSRLDKLEAAFGQLIESMTARTEASKAKMEASKVKTNRYKAEASQATSRMCDPYSIDACMDLLNSMEDVSSKMYNNALAKFTEADWRRMFVRMPSFRRKDWLASLE